MHHTRLDKIIKILLYFNLSGNANRDDSTSPGIATSSKLVDQITQLQSEKSDLFLQLESTRGDTEALSLQHLEKAEALHQVNVKLQNENENLRQEIDNIKILGADAEVQRSYRK